LVETSSKQTRFNFGCKSFFILKKTFRVLSLGEP
jgi:hypothetical protein